MLGKKNPNAIDAMRAARPKAVSEETRAKMRDAAIRRYLRDGKDYLSKAGLKGSAARWNTASEKSENC